MKKNDQENWLRRTSSHLLQLSSFTSYKQVRFRFRLRRALMVKRLNYAGRSSTAIIISCNRNYYNLTTYKYMHIDINIHG